MIKSKKDFIVYHGSYTEVSKIDLSKCDLERDFGQGFYVTTDRNQAIDL